MTVRKKPKVTVFVWSYNNADTIRECLESVLSQEYSSFEVIVHDDASTDSTPDILREYERLNPGRFRNILRIRNLYSHGKDICQPCATEPKGDFVALMHGDDFWTDPLKLEKQVALIEQTGATASGHRVKTLGRNREFDDLYVRWDDGQIVGLNESFSIRSPFATSSLVFRTEILNEILVPLPRWMKNVPFADRPLVHFAAVKGGVVYHDDEMGAYRLHPEGASNSIASVSSLERSCLLYQRLYRLIPGAELVALAPLWQNFFGGLIDATEGESKLRFKLRLAKLLWRYPEFWGIARERHEKKMRGRRWKAKRAAAKIERK